MVFGLFGGSHLIQAQSPPDAVWQPCASDTSFLLTYCSRPYDYTMGYEFSPRANGQITQLCGYFNGTKRVKLWDSSYSVLASSWITNDVTSNGIGILSSNWSCSDITPVDVTSSSTYYVTVDGGGSGLCYNTVQSSDLLPQRCADNKINISNSVLQPTSGTFNSSHNSSTKYMYGVVDVVFEIDEIPVISVTPTSRNFGSVGIGSTDDLTFTVQNTGTGTLTGSVTGLADPFTCVSNCSYSLTAGQSRNTTIRFTPTVTGVFTDVAIFSIAGGTSLNRDVVGIGTIPSPVISVAPTSRDFGPVEIGSTDDLIFTVQNTGTGTLTGTASVTTPFSCVGGCSYSLTAGQSQNTTIRFTPTVEGAASETVSFTGASGTSTTVDGSGVVGDGCTGATIHQTPVTATCSSAYPGWACAGSRDGSLSSGWFSSSSSDPQWIYFDLGEEKCISEVGVYPHGSYPNQITNIEISDNGSSWGTPVATSWTISNAGQWNYRSFTETTGRYIRLYLTSTPGYTSVVEFEAITRNKEADPCSGTAHCSNLVQDCDETGVNCGGVDCAACSIPAISVTPTSRDFGPVEIGSTDDLTFAVQNTGTGTLTGTASVTTPFSCVGGCSYSLTAGQSQNTTIRFTPTAEGAASETVSFTGASGTSTTVDGSGVETPAISVTPTSRDFGPVEIGSTDDLTFTVQNTGTGTLTGSMTGLAAPFTCISNCSYSLTAGQSQNTIVRFTPTSVATSSDVAIFSIAGGTSLNRNIVGSGVSTGGGGACQNHNVEGWAFANVPQAAGNSFEGLNWISFSCENQSASVDYGVDIETNGNLTGYAYFDMNDLNTTADEMGWIDFNPTSGFPTAPNFSARVDLDGTTCGRVGRICGWARAVNTDTSWDGWLKLSGSNYETTLDSSTTPSVIDGWAWGSDILGWVKIDAETSFSVNPPPSVTELRVEGNIGYCTSIQRRGYGTITWLYDGDSNQDEYELQIFTNASFSGATSIIRSQSIATGSRGSTGLAVLPTFSFSDLEIGYNDRYYLRIMVKDSSDNWSDWSNTLIIDTARHAYPYPQFTWDPSSPAVDETVIIDNTSICYNNSNNPVNCSSYSWTKPASANYMDATSSSSFEPHIQFTETGDNTLELLARDSRNYTCTRSSVVGIKLPFPDWIEVNPE